MTTITRTESAPAYQEGLRRKGRPVAAMPDEDAVIDAMDRALRREVGETWARRAHEELKASMGFAILSQKLLAVGAAPDAMSRVARAVADEVRHAEICRALSSRYLAFEGGVETAWPGAVHVEVPEARGDALITASIHMVKMGCVNETIASVFIEASLEAAVSPSVRAALGLILADEVEHGRAGWVYLAGVMNDARIVGAVQRELASIVRNVVTCWFDDMRISLPDGAPEHGLPSNDATHLSVLTAVRDIVLPGFAQLGFDVREAAVAVETFAKA